jgi:hypothetical protein
LQGVDYTELFLSLYYLFNLRAKNFLTDYGFCPTYCIGDDLLHVFVMIGGIGFVTGLEIEDISVTALIAATASEQFAAFIPACKYKLIRFGN